MNNVEIDESILDKYGIETHEDVVRISFELLAAGDDEIASLLLPAYQQRSRRRHEDGELWLE